MKNKKKIRISLFVIWMALISLTTSCQKFDREEFIKGTVTADTEGVVVFMYSRTNSSNPDFCTFTSNLPSPNDHFMVAIEPDGSTGKMEIKGLAGNQVVTWTASVSGKPLNHGSVHFVHIIN